MKYLVLAIFGLVVISSCGDDVDCNPNNFATQVNAQVQNYNNALQNYIDNSTDENCNLLRDAARDYKNTVEDFKDCGELDQAQYQAQLTQANNAVDNINCN